MIEDARIDRVKHFAEIWWKSRSDAGKSQEYMALGLGVSKKTIQNWEHGASAPNLFQGCEWFRLLGLNPTPYYLSFLFPSLFELLESPNADEKAVEDTLVQLIRSATSREKQQLLFLMTGSHGSSWHALLQMFTAHCHTSLQARVSAARSIMDNYEIEEEAGHLVCPECIRPDLKLLEQAIASGKHAAQQNEPGYIVMQPLKVGDELEGHSL